MSEPYLPPEDEEARVTQAKHGEQRDSFLLRTSKLLVAGTVGGFVECVASYPFDTVKTRMQTQAGTGGVLKCFSTAIREDGALALYRGMSSRLVASMVAASVMFGANGTLKDLFHADSSKPLSGRFLAAAVGTGVLEAVAYCPFELVKTRMQVLRGSQEGVTVLSMSLRIYRSHGLFKGCYKGFSSMLLREGVGNSVYFSSYELCKQAIVRGGSSPSDEPGITAIAGAGGVAGVLYAVAVHPIDTVKSLVQTDSIRRPRYHGFADGLKQALARGGGGFRGFFALYRGLSPAMVRAFIGNAVLFLTFESTMDAFGR